MSPSPSSPGAGAPLGELLAHGRELLTVLHRGGSVEDLSPGAARALDDAVAGGALPDLARLVHQATHDPLTALPNRADLLDRLDQLSREDPEATVACLYVDLDGFKAVNDTLGHGAGDQVLTTVADRLRRALRPEDLVARLGGDEFVVVARRVTDPAVALVVAGRILDATRLPVGVGARSARVSASVGVAVGRLAEADRLLDDADVALYRAKEEGRDRAVVYRESMRAPEERRSDPGEVLRRALEQDTLEVSYRPLLDLATGRIAGVEAELAVAGSGTVSTAELLDVADRCGLSAAVGTGLVDHACAHAAGRLAGLPVAVPVTARQLRADRAAARIASVADLHHVDPGLLCLQLRERELVEADSAVTRTLEELRARGVRLAVDGFGGGRDALGAARRHHVDQLRIDPELVAGIGADEAGTELARAAVRVAAALGATAVACGVDDPVRLDLLRSWGCGLAQGPVVDHLLR